MTTPSTATGCRNGLGRAVDQRPPGALSTPPEPAPVLVLAVHGTRSPAGIDTTHRLADVVRSQRPELDVRVGFVDVAAPVFADVVAAVIGPLVVVPVLLSGGYHVRIDIPRVLRASPDAVVAPPLGPDRALSLIMAERLAFARAGRAAPVLLVSTGSSDASARGDVRTAAADLGDVLGEPVRPVFMTGPGADFDAALAGAPVDVVSYLLAPGTFVDRLRRQALAAGAQAVTEPLGAHPDLAALIVRRYDRARLTSSSGSKPAVQ